MKLLERTISQTYKNDHGVVFSVHHTLHSNGDGVVMIEEKGKEFLVPPSEVSCDLIKRDDLLNIIKKIVKRNN